MLTGMDARAANITSTVALFPAQLVTGLTGRADPGARPGCRCDALHHQPRRRRPWGANPPCDAAVVLRPPRALAGAVCDRAVRLGQFFPQTAEARRSASFASGRGPRAVRHRDLWRLFRRRDRPSDDGCANHAGLRCATRGRQEHPRRRHQCLGGGDLRLSKDVHWLQAAVTAVGGSFGGWAGALMLRRVNEKLLSSPSFSASR